MGDNCALTTIVLFREGSVMGQGGVGRGGMDSKILLCSRSAGRMW